MCIYYRERFRGRKNRVFRVFIRRKRRHLRDLRLRGQKYATLYAVACRAQCRARARHYGVKTGFFAPLIDFGDFGKVQDGEARNVVSCKAAFPLRLRKDALYFLFHLLAQLVCIPHHRIAQPAGIGKENMHLLDFPSRVFLPEKREPGKNAAHIALFEDAVVAKSAEAKERHARAKRHYPRLVRMKLDSQFLAQESVDLILPFFQLLSVPVHDYEVVHVAQVEFCTQFVLHEIIKL